jgi:hypothetical protein
MKIAVCISGLVNGNYTRRNIEVFKQKFPSADFYYATWTDQKEYFKRAFPKDTCFYFDSPKIHYHPYEAKNFTSVYWEDTKNWLLKNRKWEWARHHTKQHIIHAYLLNSIDKDYDVIVRTRFDAFAWRSDEANFMQFVEDSFVNNRANCFAVTQKPKFKELYESDYNEKPRMKEWCLDQLIIHPRKLFDTDAVLKLFKEELLRPAEFGWYQTLSEPYGSNHRNWHGWVNHEKNIEKRFLNEE